MLPRTSPGAFLRCANRCACEFRNLRRYPLLAGAALGHLLLVALWTGSRCPCGAPARARRGVGGMRELCGAAGTGRGAARRAASAAAWFGQVFVSTVGHGAGSIRRLRVRSLDVQTVAAEDRIEPFIDRCYVTDEWLLRRKPPLPFQAHSLPARRNSPQGAGAAASDFPFWPLASSYRPSLRFFPTTGPGASRSQPVDVLPQVRHDRVPEGVEHNV
ncbi:hypothetical protein SAMN04488020_109169 [Palleronia marisminoris]|nr:hypothetical protein SAMN04488020_109169 [Palleronia marisminoris]